MGQVIIIDTQSTHIAPDAVVGDGTRILPNTVIGPGCVIGKNCTIGPLTHMKQARVGDGCTVENAQVEDSVLQQDVQVGPYAHIRAGCDIGARVRVGSFVQLKNVKLGADSAVPHLAYLGDATVGERSNIGCHVTTANFDGVAKHETHIGDDAFVGCHCTLVAPVSIGDGAWTAAGSVITDSVPDDGLGIARPRQTTREQWAAAHIQQLKDGQ